MIRVYIAAPKTQVERARGVAALLAALPGVAVVSTWHRHVRPTDVDPTDVREGERILGQNVSDQEGSTLTIALTADNEGRETYVEIGRALAAGDDVLWSRERGGLALSASACIVVETDADAVDTVRQWARKNAPR